MKKYVQSFKEGNKRTKLRYISLWSIRLISLLVIVYAIVKGIMDATKVNYSTYVNLTFQALVLLLLTFVPILVEKIWKVKLPFIIVIIFLFMSLCSFLLGEIADFYIKYEWWDDFLHTFAGLYMAACAFFLLSVLNERRNVPFRSSPGFVIMFAFVTALAFECLWEIIEYVVDEFFGTNMQRAFLSQPFVDNGPVTDISDPLFNAKVGRSALNDTMGDIIEVVIGAVITCIIGYIGLKYEEKMKNFTKDKILKRKKKSEEDTFVEPSETSNVLEEKNTSSIENDTTKSDELNKE